MQWLGKKENFFTNLGTRIRSLSSNRSKNKPSYLTFHPHLRIPILVHTIHVTQASTQTRTINGVNNNNAEETKSNRSHRRHYRRRFNKCLIELMEKYPPIPPHEYLQAENSHQSSILNNDEMTSDLWSKLLQSRENLLKLNQTLEDLDQRLDSLCREELHY